MEEKSESIMFIFYTPTSSSAKASIDFGELPNGWKLIGSGITYPICNIYTCRGKLLNLYRNIFGPPSKYKYEIEFMGPKESKNEIKQLLNKKLNSLKKEELIKFYHIQNNFLPIPV
jgi:hypothetical protein